MKKATFTVIDILVLIALVILSIWSFNPAFTLEENPVSDQSGKKEK